MSRNTLHLSHLDKFKPFLIDQFIAFRPGKGDYQVLQIQMQDGQWACIYSRHDMPEHYTIDKRLDNLVHKFIKAIKEKQNAD